MYVIMITFLQDMIVLTLNNLSEHPAVCSLLVWTILSETISVDIMAIIYPS